VAANVASISTSPIDGSNGLNPRNHTVFIATDDINVGARSAPTITSFTTARMAAIGYFTITGTGFDAITAILFNGQPSTGYTRISSKEILATTPAETATTNLTVTITTFDGTGQSTNYVAPSALPGGDTAVFVDIPTLTTPTNPTESSNATPPNSGGGGGAHSQLFIIAVTTLTLLHINQRKKRA